MGPITRTCSLSLALILAVAAPASAVPGRERVDFLRSGATTFVTARAAAGAGDSRRAAILYASLAAADPADRTSARRALGQAILAGDMPLALRLARAQPAGDLGVDARLLLVSDALRSGRKETPFGADWPPELGFVRLFVEAWTLAERKRWKEAVARLDAAQAGDLPGGPFAEQKVLLLLAARRPAEARPLIPEALAQAGGRANRLRIAFATGLVASGERDAGLALLEGRDPALRKAAAQVAKERRPRLPISKPAEAYSELVTAMSINLNDGSGSALPLALAQVARHADPRNEQAILLTALFQQRSGRANDALALLRAVPDASPFSSEARDLEARTLLAEGRNEEALARARAAIAVADEQASDWVRLGDVLDSMSRHGEAAVAYGGAAAAVQAGGPGPELWSLHFLRGAALEQADMWPQAEAALELARQLAPDNPSVLNYLGYARLERGEKLDEAEALIAEASRRAPDDASITDSLGWAQYKRGRVTQAIATLQRAAAADPAQAEIHEHLGDALYTAGRKYEARFAWNAALVNAAADVRERVAAKVAAGLTPATAAP
nr:tetratricopeptide repeat protein [uncultured Sphingomonas sp.]